MADATGPLTLLLDVTNRQKLEDFMISRGVDSQTARLAAEQCSAAAVKGAAVGGLAGGLVATFATASVGGLGMAAGVVGGVALGAGATLAFREECAEVRDAAFNLADENRRQSSSLP